MINNQKYDMAENEMLKALEIDPDNCLIKLRYARLEKMQNKFDNSLKLLSDINIDNLDDNNNRMQVKYIFEMLDTRVRYSETLLENDCNYALSVLNDALKFLGEFDNSLFDFTIYNSIFKLSHVYVKTLSNSKFDTKDFINFLFNYYPYLLAAKNGHKKAVLFENDLKKLCQKLPEEESQKINDILNYKASIKDLNYGTICSLKKEKGYGFITPFNYSYQTIFFHCSQFKGDFRKLNVSDKVSFELSISDKITANNVKIYNFNDNQDKNDL